MALLYEADIRGEPPASVLDRLVEPAPEFTEDLVRGVAERREVLDEVLSAAVAPAWTLERMAAIDRTVLRVAAYELSERPDVPLGVVIDEAVELAKRYSTDDSGAFVNGVLSAIADTLRPPA